jgi:hypothetical protein
MSESAEIRFGHEANNFLSIALLGRQFPNSDDYWDGNWLTSVVVVRTGAFTGKATGYLRTDEVVWLNEQLKLLSQTLTGSAAFQTTEEWIVFKIDSVGKLGHLRLSGILLEPIYRDSQLRFSIGFDQTYLPPLLKQLHHVTTRFPVIGKR